MDAVTMLRDLWRHRSALVGLAALSVIVGYLVLYAYSPPFGLESRKYTVGVANTRVLIDTPSSQIAAIAPEGSGVGSDLGMRADLLSRIMVEGTVKAKIAETAGLSPNALFGVSQSADDAGAPPPPRGAPVLSTQVVVINYSTQLPLIQIEAQARDAASAARIADAAVKGLRDYVDDQAADTSVPDSRRVRVTPLGETQAQTVVKGPKTVFAIVASLFVFGLGCASIVGFAALVRSWRTAAAKRWTAEDADWQPGTTAGTDGHAPPAPAAVSPLRQGPPSPPSPVATSEVPGEAATRAQRRRSGSAS